MSMVEDFLAVDSIRRERARKHPVLHGLEEGYRAAAFMALFMIAADSLSYQMFEGRTTPRVLFVAVFGGIAMLRAWLGLRFARAAT